MSYRNAKTNATYLAGPLTIGNNAIQVNDIRSIPQIVGATGIAWPRKVKIITLGTDSTIAGYKYTYKKLKASSLGMR